MYVYIYIYRHIRGFVQKRCFSIIDVINLSASLKIEVTMKKLLHNKFWKQVNLPGKIYLIYLTKIPKLRGETNFTYHPAYSKLKHILSNINLLLTPDAQYRVIKSQWKKKQIGNLVVVRQNAAKFALFRKKEHFY